MAPLLFQLVQKFQSDYFPGQKHNGDVSFKFENGYNFDGYMFLGT